VLGLVVAGTCRPLILRISLIPYVLDADSGRYADALISYSREMWIVLQLLQSVIGMVDECKSAVKSLRQQCQLTSLRTADLQADINQRAGLARLRF